MRLRRALVVGLVAVLCLSNAPPAARAVQTDYGQITFENHASVSLECYVDGEYVGTALKGLFITVEATGGRNHTVKAVAVEDRDPPRETEDTIFVDEGGTTTWTVRDD